MIVETSTTNFKIFGLTRLGLEPTIYRTQGEYANNDAIDAVHLPGDISGFLDISEQLTIYILFYSFICLHILAHITIIYIVIMLYSHYCLCWNTSSLQLNIILCILNV